MKNPMTESEAVGRVRELVRQSAATINVIRLRQHMIMRNPTKRSRAMVQRLVRSSLANCYLGYAANDDQFGYYILLPEPASKGRMRIAWMQLDGDLRVWPMVLTEHFLARLVQYFRVRDFANKPEDFTGVVIGLINGGNRLLEEGSATEISTDVHDDGRLMGRIHGHRRDGELIFTTWVGRRTWRPEQCAEMEIQINDYMTAQEAVAEYAK